MSLVGSTLILFSFLSLVLRKVQEEISHETFFMFEREIFFLFIEFVFVIIVIMTRSLVVIIGTRFEVTEN